MCKTKSKMNTKRSKLHLFSIYFLHFTYFNPIFAQPISNSPNTSSSPHLCPNDESIALLELTKSFTIDGLGSTSTWNKDIDCCKWVGITCDPNTNHVTSLDLSNGGIVGTIDNNSTLFQLQYLESLNLAFNFFSSSLISPQFGQLTYLKHLNLSDGFFSGEVPIELVKLSRLETLDLSSNTVGMPSFDVIIKNMTKLKRLNLGDTFFDSSVFPSLTNLTSLEYLGLFNSHLQEELPFSLLNLPRLEYLDVGSNTAIYANFELYNWSSPLQYLNLDFVNFTSKIPEVPGRAPYELLRVLRLSECNFIGEVPSWIWSSPKLEEIRVGFNQFNGVPSKFLQQITSTKLELLDLRANNFTGNITFYSIYRRFPKLYMLMLSNNKLVVTTRDDTDPALTNWPIISVLGLSACGLNEIPHILKNQSYLTDLDISYNNIHGKLPEWLLQPGNDMLEAVDLSHNFFEGSLEILPWTNLWFLDLSSNMFHGKLPIPSTTTLWYATANNNFSGSIDPSICDINSIQLLDLSNNSLGGAFPGCLGNMSNDLMVLNLGSNNIIGKLPLNFTKCYTLQYLDLSNNRLQGPLSQSLAGCEYLQYVNFRNNRLEDEFPLWLHYLPRIQVIDLSFNSFYGHIPQKIENPFRMLQILDLSNNHFDGIIPTSYIDSFRAMMNSTEAAAGGRQYMKSFIRNTFSNGYSYSMVISIGGTERIYQKIISTLTTFVLSKNGFTGEIPERIGKLIMIHSLNVSHNKISGKIPNSIGDLKWINSLDLSGNDLIGEIPQTLSGLTSLGVFNVSNNRLVGEIPRTNHFNTLFQSSSYQNNLGLCGYPLSECNRGLLISDGNSGHGKSGKLGFLNLSIWEITIISYGFGTLLGIAWGYYWLQSGKLFFLTKWNFIVETKIYEFYKKRINRRRESSGSR